ncbi:MAG: hypothetical protein NXI22_07915 [bacterium]|nr:hypothetical protein [bacterium]
MPAAGFLQFHYLSWFAKPVADRALIWSLQTLKPKSIVQLGVGDGQRASRLLDVALRFSSAIRYTGIDLFEGRDDENGLSLKAAHQLLGSRGAKVQLAPGEPLSALSRLANSLTGTDLLIIGADQCRDSLQMSWMFVPRMLHEHSAVFLEDASPEGVAKFRKMNSSEIAALASAGRKQRQRAA